MKNRLALHHRPYFFDRGIRFECRRCGQCCTGEPGIVEVDRRETRKISRWLGISFPKMVDQYLFSYEENWSVREHPDGRCYFFENGCRIYPVRPRQCRTYPFWIDNLRSQVRWLRVARACPGIGTGPLYPKERILDLLAASLTGQRRQSV